MANRFKTVLLLGVLTGIILFIGSFWGEQGLTIALVFSIAMNFGSYFFSDKIALSMYRAQPVTREQAPEIYRIMDFLCTSTGIPLPKLYIIPSDSPNAFATGRNPQHASVAVTQGALKLLDEKELTGVLAPELAHVKNRDILISSIAATMAGAIMWISYMARFAAKNIVANGLARRHITGNITVDEVWATTSEAVNGTGSGPTSWDLNPFSVILSIADPMTPNPVAVPTHLPSVGSHKTRHTHQ